jgi:hypothetical protein
MDISGKVPLCAEMPFMKLNVKYRIIGAIEIGF